MQIAEAVRALQPQLMGLPSPVLQPLMVNAMRRFCFQSRVVMRTHEQSLLSSQQAFIAAPDGLEIIGFLVAESSTRGRLDVGLMESVGSNTKPAIQPTEARVALLAQPSAGGETIKVIYSCQPAVNTPYVPEELVNGQWREAVKYHVLHQAAVAPDIIEVDGGHARYYLKAYQELLSEARRVASTLGEQQTQRVPYVNLDGLTAPTDVAAPPTGYSPFSNDMGTVDQEIGSVIDMGGF